ncbi:MAG: hypothetical protein E7465_05625 [Ruminococcaceae bacterium]|nr:hypothetical protein [Oscillospiraceae bacterium]
MCTGYDGHSVISYGKYIRTCSTEHVKQELLEYVNYYNSKVKARLKGLPPELHRQHDLLVA